MKPAQLWVLSRTKSRRQVHVDCGEQTGEVGADKYLNKPMLDQFHNLFPMSRKGASVVEAKLDDMKEFIKTFVKLAPFLDTVASLLLRPGYVRRCFHRTRSAIDMVVTSAITKYNCTHGEAHWLLPTTCPPELDYIKFFEANKFNSLKTAQNTWGKTGANKALLQMPMTMTHKTTKARATPAVRSRCVAERKDGGNFQVMHLDEATAALDTETEEHIQEALKTLAKGRT
ncbi:hypothetical protein LTR85_003923 [Meristemomyces frigidus]|nr:hypothetical protein LTR85_003923 [Meristemomyces frigidus]